MYVFPRIMLLINSFERGFQHTDEDKFSQTVKLITDNSVVNLSGCALPASVIKLLSRGLQFAPILHESGVCLEKRLINNISTFCYRVQSRLYLAEQRLVSRPIRIGSTNSDWSLSLWRFHQKFQRKCVFRRELDNVGLNIEHTELLKFLNQGLLDAVKKSTFFRCSNLSEEERGALSWLKHQIKMSHLIVCKADKGRQLVIAKPSDYNRAVKDFLQSSNNYSLVPFNKKFRTAALIRKVVSDFETCFDIRTRECLLVGTLQPRSRMFYALPKLHKPAAVWKNNFPPMRPICPDVCTETSNSAKYLALALAPIMQSGVTYFPSSTKLIQQLYQLRNLPDSCVFLIADIDSLYPSIQPEEAYNVVEAELRKSTPNAELPQKHLNFLLRLLKVQILNNTFEFDGECFEQHCGIPMGRAWAPAVAGIFMSHWDSLLVNSLEEKPVFFKRYLDDLLIIANSETHALNILRTMQNVLPNIKVGSHSMGKIVNFLDVQLTLVRNTQNKVRLPFISHIGICRCTYPDNRSSVQSQLYRKPSDLIVLLDYSSNHSAGVKCGTLFGQCTRILNISSHLPSAGMNIRLLCDLMIELRNFPNSSRWKIHRRVLEYLAKRVLNLSMHGGTRTMNDIHSRVVHMYVPALYDSHYLARVLSDFNSRLSAKDLSLLHTRVHNEFTRNLLQHTRIFKNMQPLK
jgi:hypothetical protein